MSCENNQRTSLDPATVRIFTAQHQPHPPIPAPDRRPSLISQFREAAAFNVSHPDGSSYSRNDLELSRSILTATRAESETQLLSFTQDWHMGQIQNLIEFCDGLSASLNALYRHGSPHLQRQRQCLDELIELRLFVAHVYPKLLRLQEWMNIPAFPIPQS